ncbi:ABC transporter permease [Catalinimonas niigatensis]|uniref:ABC transporter permease n=1 Tax=Catalinimonas niigatensis TaxID=1397264 RepID=UPI002666B9AA|nr:ABC transporter permease [Catalinimonas niigatensis]WPP48831.1 FtsX-like permease family protein [Catalinimonas niigatensis]
MTTFFIKTILRSLLKYKGKTAINVLSLSFGMAFSGIIFLFLRYESTFDHHHRQADRIYRVNTHVQHTDELLRSAFSPQPLAEALRSTFPEEMTVTQTIGRISGQLLVYPDRVNPDTKDARIFEEGSILFVDSSFAQTFDYTWLAGDPTSALKVPNGIVFQEGMADKLYPDQSYEEILGEVVVLNEATLLTVTGVIEYPPLNSNLFFTTLIHHEALSLSDEEDWEELDRNCTFITLREGVNQETIQDRLNELVKSQVPDEDLQQRLSFHLMPLKELHFAHQYRKATSLYTIPAFLLWPIGGIGLIMIVVACINFINLATAQAMSRSKEVGIRKVLGSRRRQLYVQFMGETAVITFVALLLGLGLGELAVKYFQQLVPFIYLQFGMDHTLIYFIVGIAVLVTLLAGTYPALVLSRFNPLQAIRHGRQGRSGGGGLRKTLVVTQFVVAQFFIMCTIGLAFQFAYLSKRNLGFEKDGIITLSYFGEDEAYLRNELLKNKGIQGLSFSSGTPISGEIATTYAVDTAEQMEQKPVLLKYVDTNFLQTFGIALMAGRNFEEGQTQQGLIINKALVQEMGFDKAEEALGSYLTVAVRKSPLPVIGIVPDYSNQEFERKGDPEAFIYQPDQFNTVNVKTYGENLPEVTTFLEKIWKERYPERTFSYTFMDDAVKQRLGEDKLFVMVFGVFSGIAIFICCLGLFGLVSFVLLQKEKEVGIRKVVGASVNSIILLFNMSFFKLILIAFVVAAPLAYLLLQSFLQTNTYKITLGPWIFLIGLLATVGIAFLTTGYKSWKAALANPVDSLRNE